MNNLNFRLSDKGGSIAASTTDPALQSKLHDAAMKLVLGVFDSMHHVNPRSEGKTPEVISDATLAQIEALESALEFCRNLMIDANVEDDSLEDDWTRAIDEAADALGYAEDER